MADQTAQPPPPTPPRRALAPPTAFLIVVSAVLAAGAGATLLGKKSSPPTPTVAEGRPEMVEQEELTETEALVVFEALVTKLRDAVESRKTSDLEFFLAEPSPILKRTVGTIEELRSDGVRDQSAVATDSMTVRSLGESQLVVRETFDIHPCFVDENGEDVSTGSKAVRITTDWQLQVESGVWKIFDSTAVDSVVLGRNRATCP